MNNLLSAQDNQVRTTVFIVVWLLFLGLGAGMTWYGFTQTGEAPPPSPSATPLSLSQATATRTIEQPVLQPTATPTLQPTATQPPPTASPPTVTPTPTPYIVAGVDGVNVREGPGTEYTRLGYIEPDAQAPLVDQDGDWWQILYEDNIAWIYSPLVTAYNTGETQTEAQPPTEAPTVPPTSDSGTAPSDETSWAAEVFRLINIERENNDISPYTYNDVLEKAAQLHGEDCQQRGSCDHTGSDGSTVSERVERAGYAAAGASEVIVYSTSPQAAVAWWMDETPPNDPHRSALLSTWVSEIGVAAVPTGRGDYYFIVVFGRPGG